MTNIAIKAPEGVNILAQCTSEQAEILTPEALSFMAGLHRKFAGRVEELLAERVKAQRAYESGKPPGFREETAEIRNGDWTVAPLPEDLLDRRVEITGPVDRKMVINALNSGANVFMADFEDANSPTWDNQLTGQLSMRDAVRRTISFEDTARGKSYKLNDKIATLMVRPRGWHLEEAHFLVDDKPIPGGLFDFGLFFFHNAKAQIERGAGPYFYLPKLQSHLEARLWNDVFVHAQSELGIPNGTIKATVLIETLPAAFEMNEILWELRDHSAGLNCGRWDYIFSYIKTMGHDADHILPDRSQVSMEQPFMRAYTQLVIKTCHRRNVHAMGGMAAQIPIKSDPEANRAALDKVRADKLREVKDGHDGTWVAHPGLVPVAKEIFDAYMKGKNQLDVKREDYETTEEELRKLPEGGRTIGGVRQNVNVGLLYIESWVGGTGCVPLYNLMEDAATAEISRTQLWQWQKLGATLDDGTTVTPAFLEKIIDEEMAVIKETVGEERFNNGKFELARKVFQDVVTADELPMFYTLAAYPHLIKKSV